MVGQQGLGAGRECANRARPTRWHGRRNPPGRTARPPASASEPGRRKSRPGSAPCSPNARPDYPMERVCRLRCGSGTAYIPARLRRSRRAPRRSCPGYRPAGFESPAYRRQRVRQQIAARDRRSPWNSCLPSPLAQSIHAKIGIQAVMLRDTQVKCPRWLGRWPPRSPLRRARLTDHHFARGSLGGGRRDDALRFGLAEAFVVAISGSIEPKLW